MDENQEILVIQRRKTLIDDPAAAQRKRDRENGRQQAQEYASEALLRAVQIMRTSGDEDKVLKAAIYVCNRAWGTPKAEQNEDPKLANKTILDILEQVSLSHAKVEQDLRQKAIEARPVHPAEVTTEYELIEGVTDDRSDGL